MSGRSWLLYTSLSITWRLKKKNIREQHRKTPKGGLPERWSPTVSRGPGDIFGSPGEDSRKTSGRVVVALDGNDFGADQPCIFCLLLARCSHNPIPQAAEPGWEVGIGEVLLGANVCSWGVRRCGIWWTNVPYRTSCASMARASCVLFTIIIPAQMMWIQTDCSQSRITSEAQYLLLNRSI